MRRATLVALALLWLIGCGDDRPSGTDGGGGGGADAGPGSDAGGGEADGGGEGLDGGGGGTDAGPPAAEVGLTFSGDCAPDFGGDVVVVRNTDSIAVSSTRGGALVGSIQLALEDGPGTVNLSTQHRIDSGSVINVIVDTTWTNIAMDSAGVLGGTVTDPIGGQLTIRAYDEAAGMVDIDFAAVTLQNPSTGSICQIDGRLQTFRLSF